MPRPDPLWLIPLAPLPGLYAWWSGRTLRRLSDHLLLADRALLRNQQLTVAYWLATAALIVMANGAAFMALTALMLSALLAASYRLRRALMGERTIGDTS